MLMFHPLSRGAGVTHDRTWINSGSFWLKITPFGFRKILKFIKDEYGNPPVYVTENGISERGAVNLNDMHRTHYYKNYINQALKGTVSSTKTYQVFSSTRFSCFVPCLQPSAKAHTVLRLFTYMRLQCAQGRHCCQQRGFSISRHLFLPSSQCTS